MAHMLEKAILDQADRPDLLGKLARQVLKEILAQLVKEGHKGSKDQAGCWYI
jgi:hypothetical protein